MSLILCISFQIIVLICITSCNLKRTKYPLQKVGLSFAELLSSSVPHISSHYSNDIKVVKLYLTCNNIKYISFSSLCYESFFFKKNSSQFLLLFYISLAVDTGKG